MARCLVFPAPNDRRVDEHGDGCPLIIDQAPELLLHHALFLPEPVGKGNETGEVVDVACKVFRVFENPPGGLVDFLDIPAQVGRNQPHGHLVDNGRGESPHLLKGAAGIAVVLRPDNGEQPRGPDQEHDPEKQDVLPQVLAKRLIEGRRVQTHDDEEPLVRLVPVVGAPHVPVASASRPVPGLIGLDDLEGFLSVH